MKKKRQQEILDIISQQEIATQEMLQDVLMRHGFAVTQATVSRDINELRLKKIQTESGSYRYTQESVSGTVSDKLAAVLRNAVVSVHQAKNLVVIKTITGMGGAAGAAADSINLHGTVGTLAGDDTLLIIAGTDEDALYIKSEYERITGIN